MALTTNLAHRPFRNERLPWLLAILVATLAISISVAHGRFMMRLLSGGEARTVQVVLGDEARIAELETALLQEPPVKLESSETARLRAFKELVDQRVFPWRRLLGELETLLSDDVRLTRIAPAVLGRDRGVLLTLAGEARTKDAAFSFAEGLNAAPAFSNAALKSLSDADGVVDFDLEVAFVPGPPKSRTPAPAQAGGPVPTPGGVVAAVEARP